MDDQKKRILQWVQSLREDHKQNTHQEERKEEILGILRGLVKTAEHLKGPSSRYTDRVKWN